MKGRYPIMKKNTQYEINYATNTITLNHRFAKAAGILGSEEFQTMKELRELGMKITVLPQKERKGNKSRLSYVKMSRYIACLADSDNHMKDFEAIRTASKSSNNPYQYVWKWFMSTFPNYANIPEFDEDRKIVVTPSDYVVEEVA